MNSWDLYWADVPYEEDSTQSKERPVVIIKDIGVILIVMRVTTHEARDGNPFDYPLSDWKSAGLNSPSVVRISKLAQLKPDKIGDYIGRLRSADIVAIQRCMGLYKQYLQQKRSETQ